MKRLFWPLFFALIIGGCAAYKELQPDPALNSAERGYVELKNNKDNFDLDHTKKYFIKFPPPAQDHFKLVLVTNVKPVLRASLSPNFAGKEGEFTTIPEESAGNDSVYAYTVDPRMPMFAWVIDSVRRDVQLSLSYRYVPEWRYTFEVKSSAYEQTINTNAVDRGPYESITMSTDPATINTRRELATLDDRTGKLVSMQKELESLASLFPPNIASSRDTAYRRYVDLKSRLSDEIDFQQNYTRVLTVIRICNETRGSAGGFVSALPQLADNMSHIESFPGGAAARLRSLVSERMDEIIPFYDRLLGAKTNTQPIAPALQEDAVSTLYRACNKPVSREMAALTRFIQLYNTESAALSTSAAHLRELDKGLSGSTSESGGSFFRSQLSKAVQIKTSIPEPTAASIEPFGNSPAAANLAQEILRVRQWATDEQTMYEGAVRAEENLAAHLWPEAESGVRQIGESSNYLSSSGFVDQRGVMIRRVEGDLFQAVKEASQQRVNTFIREHEGSYANVPKLYQDSAFSPVYVLSYSSMGTADLMAKQKQITDYLNQIKFNLFPESSIKAIYASFIKNLKDDGVEKARGIVEHGKFYRGEDRQVRGLIEECNPLAAKWIVKPKEYRRLFALPITNNPYGMNDYVFRVGLKIPSEAQFPVFDVSIKLPPDVAKKAASQQWYDEITLDKKPIRNEGRFRITAPLPDNDYESQISPVQMDKAGNNILEVRFKHQGFEVLEISTMAQVPIIRKN